MSKPVDIDLEGQGYVAPFWSLHGLQHAVDRRSLEIDPKGVLSPLFFATEFGGESGEAQNVVKKLEREKLGIDGRRDTPEHLADELGDVIVTACNLARQYNIDLTAAITRVFNRASEERKLSTRLQPWNKPEGKV